MPGKQLSIGFVLHQPIAFSQRKLFLHYTKKTFVSKALFVFLPALSLQKAQSHMFKPVHLKTDQVDTTCVSLFHFSCVIHQQFLSGCIDSFLTCCTELWYQIFLPNFLQEGGEIVKEVESS